MVDIHSKKFIEFYDALPFWSAPFGQLLLKYVPLKADATLLDIGCGTGFPLMQLAARVGRDANLHAIDPWEAAMERTKAKIEYCGYSNIELKVSSASAMDYQDDFFDLIVSNLGINNFENPSKVCSECWRILKPHGRLAITTNLIGHMREFYEVYRSTLKELSLEEYLPKLDKEETHRATLESATSLFQECGFKVERVFEDSFSMRYANGTTFLTDPFNKMAFMDSWKSVLPIEHQDEVFEKIEANLNKVASSVGELELTIPMAYIEVVKVQN